MLPPLPPSPPEGPPRGTYFSRRKATQPLPPLPAFKNILASSTNTRVRLQKKDNTSELPVGRSSELHEKAPGLCWAVDALKRKTRSSGAGPRERADGPGRPPLNNAVSLRRTWLAQRAQR